MEIGVITSRYPSQEDIYAHMWVHSRAKEFLKSGMLVTVFVPANIDEKYTYEGVSVVLAPAGKIAQLIESFPLLYIHLLNIYPYPNLSGWPIYKSIMKNRIKCFMYLHGSEVQSTQRYSFDYKRTLYAYAVQYYKKYIFLPRMRKFCQYVDTSGGFLSPSNWMLDEASNELKLALTKVVICPNGIDTKLFTFNAKHRLINKMVCVRPLSSKKYAVDQGIRILAKLPESYTLDIYGKGELKTELADLAKQLGVENRVTFVEKYIHRVDLPSLMSKYGTFIATTRMDAQGVIMCEAMAAGLLVLTSDNTAIPEFVTHMKTGICHNDLEIHVKELLSLECSEEAFKRIVNNAREYIVSIDLAEITKKELTVLLS